VDFVSRAGTVTELVSDAEEIPAPSPRLSRTELRVLLLFCAGVLAFCAIAPLMRLGDASDYILTTESLWFDHDLKLTEADLARHALRKPVWFDSPRGLETVAGRDGNRYLGLWHSFYYPLFAVPFYAVFGYRGFYLANGALFCLTAFCLLRHSRRFNGPTTALSWMFAALLFSAALGYVAWIHPETFLMAAVALFAFFYRRGNRVIAAVFLGIAVGAQPILAGIALPIAVLELFRRPRWRTALSEIAAFLAFALPQYLMNLAKLGVVHPMLTTHVVGASFVDPTLILRSFIDPAAGIVWFYPAIVLAVFFARWDAVTIAFCAAAVLTIVAGGTSSVWYSHQIGYRYGSYVFPLFLLAVDRVSFAGWRGTLGSLFVLFSGTGLLVNAVGNSISTNVDEKLLLPYRVIRKLPIYREELSITWNRMHKIAPAVGATAIWDDGWIPSNTWLTMMFVSMPDGPVRLDLEAPSGSPTRLTVRTESNRDIVLVLAPGERRLVTLPLSDPGDIHRSSKGSLGVLSLKLRVDREQTAAPPIQRNDQRRLGIRVRQIFVGPQVFYPVED
jgi:hypothetical protein